MSLEQSTVTMIGAEETPLEWRQDKGDDADRSTVKIKIPDNLYGKRKNDYAWVFKITF
jgi:hypothetical protein